MTRPGLGGGVALITLIIVGAIGGFLAARLLWAPAPTTDREALQQDPATATPGPTATYYMATATPLAPGRPSWQLDDDFRSPYKPVASYVELADIVAEVVIEEVRSAQFNTSTGAFPTSEAKMEAFELANPVVARVTTYHKGDDPATTGFVFPRFGGEFDGFRHNVLPDIAYEVGASGMLFLRLYPEDWYSNPPDDHRFKQMLDVANELEAPDQHYKPAKERQWFEYSGAEAHSQLNDETMSIAELVQEVEAALTPTTPHWPSRIWRAGVVYNRLVSTKKVELTRLCAALHSQVYAEFRTMRS